MVGDISLHLLKFFGFSNSYAQLLKCMERALGQKNLNLYDSKNSMASVCMCIESHCVRASCTALAARARTDTCCRKIRRSFLGINGVSLVWWSRFSRWGIVMLAPAKTLSCLQEQKQLPVHSVHFVNSVHSLLIHNSKRHTVEVSILKKKLWPLGFHLHWETCSITGTTDTTDTTGCGPHPRSSSQHTL